MLKIAIATSDGTNINEHFGRAEVFRIYKFSEEGTFCFFEERRILPHCPGDPSVRHDADATIEQLADVNAVLVSRIGPGAALGLAERGIKAIALSGTVERALSAYGKRHRLIDVKIPGVSQGFTTAGGETCGCSGVCGQGLPKSDE